MRALTKPRRKASPEAGLLPMINVVFLLLIFLLISARLTPPEAISVTPPVAEGTPAPGDFTVLMGSDGDLAFGRVTGHDAALAALAAAYAAWCNGAACDAALTLRADALAPAASLAALLPEVARIGFARIDLATVPK